MENQPETLSVSAEPTSKLAVLIHADIVGSTDLVRENEILAHGMIQEVFQQFSGFIDKHGGKTQEIRGDALVAEFSKASDAVNCAIAFQQWNRERQDAQPGSSWPQVRVGIAMGEVVVADNTVTGEGIVLAQRLEQQASAGGICVQGAVYDTLPARLSVNFNSLGEVRLKGFKDPVRVLAVALAGEDQSHEESLPPEPTQGALEIPNKPSIAVLLFDNMSADPDQDFFAAGISEDIITELSKFRSFFVIARNSAFALKDRSMSIGEVSKTLGVRYVVEGSVRRAGSRVRVTAQLIDAVDDKHLWAERYDRELKDIFDVQDEVTAAIVTAIEPQLSHAERQRAQRKPTDNLDAWECYQRGLGHMFTYVTVDKAIDYFERSIALDPGFSSAHAGIAYSLAIRLLQGNSPNRDTDIKRGYFEAETALELDRNDPFAYFTLGRITIANGDLDHAVEAFSQAIGLNPNYALAHFGLAHALWHAGRPEEAIPHHDEAMRLSPHDPILWAIKASRAIALVMAGNYEGGIQCSRDAQRSSTQQVWSFLGEASGLALQGDTVAANDVIGRIKEFRPEISVAFICESLPMADTPAKSRFVEGLELAGLEP